jgi:hypothetical protein
MFEIGKTYKIQDLRGTYYTATIIEETETQISFTDLHGTKQGLSKLDISRWKEVVE